MKSHNLPARPRYATTLVAIAVALTATVAVPASASTSASKSASAAASPANPAPHPRSLPTGRVCLFSAPRQPFEAGHIGWAYRWDDGSDNWDYGATRGENDAWNSHGSTQTMLNTFRTHGDAGGYDFYRCTDTHGQNQAAAFTKASQVNGGDYNILTNNCLTKSIQIIKAYDNSGGLNNMDDGRWSIPNNYFHGELDKDGWGPVAALH